MTANHSVSRKARWLANSYLSSLASLGQGLPASEPAKVLLRLVETNGRDEEFANLLGAEGEEWNGLKSNILSAKSRGGRLLLCEAACAAAKKSVMANDWLREIQTIGEIRAEHGESTVALAKRLRPLLEQAAEELLEIYGL